MRSLDAIRIYIYIYVGTHRPKDAQRKSIKLRCREELVCIAQ